MAKDLSVDGFSLRDLLSCIRDYEEAFDGIGNMEGRAWLT